MLNVCKKRLEKSKLLDRVNLYCNDIFETNFTDSQFDIVFMSFTLELFDTPEIPALLSKIKTILKPGGKLGIISIFKADTNSFIIKLYEWFHKKIPNYFDCRPINAEDLIKNSGFEIIYKEISTLFGLPIEIVIAKK